MKQKLLMQTNSRHVATVTLNRPEVGNACDAEMLDLFASAIDHLRSDLAVRVIVLRGAGRHFCTGADVGSLQAAANSATPSREQITFLDVCRALEALQKPTVAVIHGACVGGGVALAACCDVVLASTEAFFSVPEVRLGIAPGPISLLSLRALGARNLRRYLLSGERFNAERAYDLGLVHEFQPAERLEATLADVIDALLLGGPEAMASAKTTLLEYDTAAPTLRAFNALRAVFDRHAASAEAQEGRASFREKRKPRWYPPKDKAHNAS